MVKRETEHIGIVACSSEGAALCYRTICAEGVDPKGRHSHPEVTMHTYPLDKYMRYIEADDWTGVADLMLSSAQKVAKTGADFIICPDNTIHQAFDQVAKKSPLPWLHIAEIVATEAAHRNYKRVGVLGTRHLMEGPVYPTKLAAANIEHLVPTKDEQRCINGVIFDQLVKGQFTARSRAQFTEIIDRLKNRGCDAVILGCTEIPLLISQVDSPLPTLDSTRLLARAALKRAIKPHGG
ncbi:MAG: amino acid racemase [Candidatus Bathyarchaeota archaeon]|nr:MAG: amino acid racemase [Candidatus Bathyarchaeota archaeon]